MNTFKFKVISLKRRQDRRKKFANTFKHINFEFVDALDGQTYKLTEFDKEFIKGNDYKNYNIHIPSLVCANYTHLNLLDECSKGDIPFIIFEDDTEIIKTLDFKFEDLVKKDLDVFWLMPNEPSILCYIIWPSGAKILINHINKVKLDRGLDWKFHEIKGSGLLREDQLSSSYFNQTPGKDSDITNLENYSRVIEYIEAMHYSKPLHKTQHQDTFYLAPIPIYKRVFNNDVITEKTYNLGLEILNDQQKRMGQELPGQYDNKRQTEYKINYDRKDEWVESNVLQPIGSRFYVEPNSFLDTDNEYVKIIKRRIIAGFKTLLENMEVKTDSTPNITESWVQYYSPTEGRGHNAHNHNRWYPSEEKPLMFSGGYYLSDGNPIKDHPYSGAFAFHIRGGKYFIRPKAGMLLIWPHDIVHSVEPFYGQSYRSVINFNIQVD